MNRFLARFAERDRLIAAVMALWIAAYAVTVAALLLAPRMRHVIAPEVIPQLLKRVTTLWIPVLGCFTGYWFAQKAGAKLPTLTSARVLAALLLTVCFLTMTVGLILWDVYAVDYGMLAKAVEDRPTGRSLNEYIDDSVELMLLLSFIGTTPVVWLTGQAAKPASRAKKVAGTEKKEVP